jgi:hypothetical protein
MKKTAMRYSATAALSGALVFATATCPFAQAQTGAGAGTQVSQYCVPLEPTFDAHRFYCGNELAPVSSPELWPT